MFICFLIAFIICGFPTVGIDLCLECYAPARLTRVIAQASLGSPCVSVRLRVLGGVGGISLGALRALRNFLANSLETVWRKFCFDEILETSFYCICKFSVMSVET